MTTTVTTKSQQVLKRTWNDLDPKVRNAIDVWVLTVATGIVGLLTKSVTPLDATFLIVPVTLAVITAYVTTSKHKELIIETVDAVDHIIHSAAPILSHDPETRTVAAAAAAVADTVDNAVHQGNPGPVPASASAELAETQVLTPSSRYASILGNLPSSGGVNSADPTAIIQPNGTVTGSTPVQIPVGN